MPGDPVQPDIPALIDTSAVLLAYAPVFLAVGALLLFAWRSIERPAFLAAWSGACLCAAIGTVILATRSAASEWLVLSIGNAAWIAAWSLLWMGARWLRRRLGVSLLVVAPPLLWMALSMVPGFLDNVRLRVVTELAIYTVLTLGAAVTLLGHRLNGRRTRGATLLAFLSVAFTLTLAGLILAHLSARASVPGTLLIGTEFVCIAFIALVIAHEQAAAADGARLAETELREVRLRAEIARREALSVRTIHTEFERLLDGLPIGVFLRDVGPDGRHRTIFAGGEIEQVTGWPRATIGDPDLLAALRAPGTPSRRVLMLQALHEGRGQEDWRLRQPDGSWRWVRTHARRLSRREDGGGEVVGYVQDISGEHDAQARAQRAARLAALGEMASGMAHELRQPLTIISFATQNATAELARNASDRLPMRLARIAEQTERANNIIEHLRLFARGAEEEVKPVPVRLDDVVRGTLTLLGETLRLADISVSYTPAAEAITALGELMLLEQVLMNLLLNARDALAGHPPGATRRISIHTAPLAEGGHVRMTVADNGGGIAPEVLPLMFQPFVTTKLASKGTGLGLSICHGIIASLGGEITAANDGEGAVFTITLPGI